MYLVSPGNENLVVVKIDRGKTSFLNIVIKMAENAWMENKMEQENNKRTKRTVLILFTVRVCLWLVALGSTAYWIYYSVRLHMDGIFAPEQYSPMLRPVLYTCLIIAIVAICISFALHAISNKIKK